MPALDAIRDLRNSRASLRPASREDPSAEPQQPSDPGTEKPLAPLPPLHCTLALYVLTVVCHKQPEGRAACVRYELPVLLTAQLKRALTDLPGGDPEEALLLALQTLAACAPQDAAPGGSSGTGVGNAP